MKISEYAAEYLGVQPRVTMMLTADELGSFVIEAAKEYQAWGCLDGFIANNQYIGSAVTISEGDGEVIEVDYAGEVYIVEVSFKPYRKQANDITFFDGTHPIAIPVIDGDFELTHSEWGVIKPLALLLAELETAKLQESSRLAGHEPSGRSASEIQGDISNFRNEYFRQWVFYKAPKTI